MTARKRHLGLAGTLVRCSGGWLHKDPKRLVVLRSPWAIGSRRICVLWGLLRVTENGGNAPFTALESNTHKVQSLLLRARENGTGDSRGGGATRRQPGDAKTSDNTTYVTSKRPLRWELPKEEV